MNTKKLRAMSGDRPTGPLHLGHYIGSLQNRLVLQRDYDLYVMVADVQALASNAGNPEVVQKNIFQVVLDYLAIGIDPKQSTIFIQSMIPEIAELTMYYLNLVTIAHLQRNPTIKEELKQKAFGESVPAGFLIHPVNQAADITIVNGQVVPVGQDQVPLIEQTVNIVRAFNRIYGETLIEPKAMVPTNEKAARLPGVDGKAKMSKSLGNAIYLSDSTDDITKKVMSMYTDPGHVRVSDPGKVEGNIVFAYLDIFDPNPTEVAELKTHYERGGLGDVTLKKRLNEILQNVIGPIRTRREQFEKDMPHVIDVLRNGTEKTRQVAAQTMARVREAMKINYF